MNEVTMHYWNAYWQNEEPPANVEAFQFGVEADELAQLVVNGVKTATCSAYIMYEIDNEALPSAGDYGIILNSKDKPVAIIETTEVTIMPMNKVPEAFAREEGEGDGTYAYWWNAHVRFFTEELEQEGMTFSEDMFLVCERFQLVDVKA